MAFEWKKWQVVIVTICAVGGLSLSAWNTISPIFEERADIQIRDINITRYPEENFPGKNDEEHVYISIYNDGKVTANDVTIDIQIDIPFYNYSIVSKEEYSVRWGEIGGNSLGLNFPQVLGGHEVSISFDLKAPFLENNSVEPTVEIYEGNHGLIAAHHASILNWSK